MDTGLLFDGCAFTVGDAACAGISRQELRTRVARHEVRRVLRGVYVDVRVPDGPLLRAAAFALVAPPGVVACRGTAAWLLGVPPVEPGRHLNEPPLELLSPAGRNGARRVGCDGFSALLKSDDVIQIDGVDLTDGVRTCLDLARHRERPDALAYVDALVRAGAARKDELLDARGRLDGLPWAEQGREIIELCDSRAESPGESWLRLRHLDAGFPVPEPQFWVYDGGVPVVRLDLAVILGELLVAEEYDGEEHHGFEQQPHDDSRRRWLGRRGWIAVGFGEREILGRHYTYERVMGDILGIEPRCLPWEARRRTYARRRRTVPPPDVT